MTEENDHCNKAVGSIYAIACVYWILSDVSLVAVCVCHFGKIKLFMMPPAWIIAVAVQAS